MKFSIQKVMLLLSILSFFACKKSRRVYFDDVNFENYESVTNYSAANIDSLIKFYNYQLEGKYECSVSFTYLELELKTDRTFVYYQGGCGFNSYSKGTWKYVKDTIYVTSYDEIEDFYYERKENVEKEKKESKTADSTSTSVTITIYPPDKYGISFTKKFILNNFDLVEIDGSENDSFENETRYIKTLNK